MTMLEIKLSLSDSLAQEAQAAALLAPAKLEQLAVARTALAASQLALLPPQGDPGGDGR